MAVNEDEEKLDYLDIVHEFKKYANDKINTGEFHKELSFYIKQLGLDIDIKGNHGKKFWEIVRKMNEASEEGKLKDEKTAFETTKEILLEVMPAVEAKMGGKRKMRKTHKKAKRSHKKTRKTHKKVRKSRKSHKKH